MLQAMEGKSRKITKVERKDHRLYLYSDMGIHRIEPKSKNTARITYTSRDTFSNKEKPGVINLSVYSDWEYRIQEDSVYYQTDNLIIQINLETASYQYFDRQGKLLLSERKKESKNLEECVFYKLQEEDEIHKEKVSTADGVKEIIREATRIPHETLYHTRLYLEWQEQEALYGLGQQEEGILNLRGHMVFLHQANRKITIPLLVSNLGYGILMDTYSPLIFSDTIYGSYLYTEADYEMDFYFINGGNIDGVIGEYRRLTGKASLLPKWAYGYIQSQERYETAEEILQIAEEYRKRKIGLDGIVLDWCYWKENLWGQKTFDPNRFQNPTEMIEQLHSMNVHFMISIWPNMSDESEDYQEFKEQGLLLPGSNVYNPLRKEGRELYWKQAKNGLFCHGVDAWWCDSSEPFTPEWNHMSRVEPSVMYQEYCQTSGMHLPASEMNNFALYHAMTMYEGQRSEEKVVGDEKRVINLTRSGYIGGQRYGIILWSGDTDASWDTLRKQIAAGLNFCASGLPYWTMDIGGFFIKKGEPWYWNGDYREGSSDLGFRELFVRWYQLGCFLPIFRGHGTDCGRELWEYGDKGDAFYDALINANQLRYKLMPYIYSLAGLVWLEDKTMMRLLAYDFPKDLNVSEIKDQYLFGNSIMVCPVTSPMYYESGSHKLFDVAKTRRVYLPEGVNWFDYWTNQYYEGGQWVEVEAPLERIPLFIKEGSILPTIKPTEYVTKGADDLFVYIYSGKDANFVLYEDDGDGYAYEQGKYRLKEFIWSEENKELIVSGYGESEEKSIRYFIINRDRTTRELIL